MNPEELLLSQLAKFATILPAFSDGRINYSDSKAALVVNVMLESDGKILLGKRSMEVLHYRGKWNSVGGYIDEVKDPEAFVRQELFEELGIEGDYIKSLHTGSPYTSIDENKGLTWYVYPYLAKVSPRPEIQLDWEHTEYKWIDPDELGSYDTIPELDLVLKSIKKFI